MSDAVESQPTQSKSKDAKRLAWIGLLLSVVGGVSYWFLLDVPWIRSEAIPNAILTIAGGLLSLFALSKQRNKVTIIAGAFSILISSGFLLSVFSLMRLPASAQTLAIDSPAPAFSLPNQDGESVSLSEFRGQGPVLLVFYRGYW